MYFEFCSVFISAACSGNMFSQTAWIFALRINRATYLKDVQQLVQPLPHYAHIFPPTLFESQLLHLARHQLPGRLQW